MEERQLAIHVEGLNKVYKLYDHNRDRLVDSLGLARKKRYREHYALRNVDLDIYQGECVGIIGTNGSGKSTILKIITGVLNETDGVVAVNGRISALLELGAGFNMEYNGIENVYLNGTMIGFSEKEIDSGYPGFCGYRRICIPARQNVFQRYVCKAGFCCGHQYRSGNPDCG